MDDLVKRLRAVPMTAIYHNGTSVSLVEAADTIEALQEKVRVATEALESIASKNQNCTWTATTENPESHWELHDGVFAVIANATLSQLRSPDHG